MKIKNVMAGVAALALAVPMFTSSAFAAPWDGSQTNAGKPTEVSYDNSLSIPDPDNPTNPTWAITVPSSIKFTDTNKKIDASVSMQAVNGGAMPGYPIYVGVKSTGGYKLTLGTEKLDYDLQYAGTSVKGTANTVVGLGSFSANLTATTTIQGTAVLSGTATATGSYTDSLTYVISKTAFTAKP